uniref:hypothetical protein n=1 Tax=Candidatus Limisoma sp. TaxID=3076476 RepID=UPI0040264116
SCKIRQKNTDFHLLFYKKSKLAFFTLFLTQLALFLFYEDIFLLPNEQTAGVGGYSVGRFGRKCRNLASGNHF